MKDKLLRNFDYTTKILTEEVILLDLKESSNRGNHKSGKRNKEHLGKAMSKEILKGWGLNLPEESTLNILGLEIAPMGVEEHLEKNN